MSTTIDRHQAGGMHLSRRATAPFLLLMLAGLGCSESSIATIADADAAISLDAIPSLINGPIGDDAVPSIVGVWRTCDAVLRFRSNGTWQKNWFSNGCQSHGRWSMHNERLAMMADSTNCRTSPRELTSAQVSIQGGRLMIIDPLISAAGFERYLEDSTPHVRWRLTGVVQEARQGTTIVSLVGDPASGGSGCYWSGNGMCDGIFSCGGVVYQWRTADGVLNAGLSCSSCTCGSSLLGTITNDHIDGHYNAQNCERVWQGTMTGTVESDAIEEPAP